MSVEVRSDIFRVEEVLAEENWLNLSSTVRPTTITKSINAVDQPLRYVLLMLPQPGGILLTRPVKELAAHISDRKLPSFELLARIIKVLVWGIFSWHLCDHIVLSTYQGFVHSMSGKVATASLEQLKMDFPYRFESGLLIRYNGPLPNFDPTDCHRTIDVPYGGENFVRCPDFSGWSVICANTVYDYFRGFFRILCTDKPKGNTIHDLLKSRSFVIARR